MDMKLENVQDQIGKESHVDFRHLVCVSVINNVTFIVHQAQATASKN